MNMRQQDINHDGALTQVTPYIIPLCLFLVAFAFNSFTGTVTPIPDTTVNVPIPREESVLHGQYRHGVPNGTSELVFSLAIGNSADLDLAIRREQPARIANDHLYYDDGSFGAGGLTFAGHLLPDQLR